MSRTMLRAVGVVAVIAALVGLLVLNRARAREEPHGAPPTPPASPTVPDGEPLALSWDVPGTSVRLANGWTLTTTSSPMVEVHGAAGDLVGIIELLDFPLGDDLAAATTETEVVSALEARVDEHHEIVAADRAAGIPGPGYTYRPGPTGTARFGDTPAVRYDAEVVEDATGEVVESHHGVMAVHAGRLWVLAADGADPELFDDGLARLDAEQAAALATHMDRLTAASPLPREGTALIDGIVVGTDGGLDGGLVYLLWDGNKQRIQQPRAMTTADIDALGLERGRRLANLTVGDARTDSFFAVVPPDGTDARLHVAIHGVLHEVVVQHVRRDVLAGIPDAPTSLLDRLGRGAG